MSQYLEIIFLKRSLRLKWGFPDDSAVTNPPAMQENQETWIQSLCWEDPLGKEMVTHSSILAWKILWTEELGRLQSAAAAKSLQSCPTLCDPIDSSPPGSPVPGILQARTLEWVAISFSMKVKSESEVAQSRWTLSDPMDCSLPGSSAHGIFQARVLEKKK